MASVATYGGFSHIDNEINLVSASYRTNYSPRHRKLTQTHTLQISGELIADGASLLTQRAISVFNAYDQDNQDFTYTVGGVQAHRLYNGSNCLSGVRVVNKNFPKGGPDELCTTRTFGATLQATYDVCEDNIVSWSESIESIGTGGPVKMLVNTVFGPYFVLVSLASAVMVNHSGSAIGFSSYPNPPPSLDEASEFFDRRRVRKTSGTQQGTGIKFYRTSWSYHYAFGTVSSFQPTSI